MAGLGGDHAITHPIMRAVRRRHKSLTILHIDAHPDIYDAYEGNRRSQTSSFARIMEEGLTDRLIQVGLRTINGHHRDQFKRFGVEVTLSRLKTEEHALALSLSAGLDAMALASSADHFLRSHLPDPASVDKSLALITQPGTAIGDKLRGALAAAFARDALKDVALVATGFGDAKALAKSLAERAAAPLIEIGTHTADSGPFGRPRRNGQASKVSLVVNCSVWARFTAGQSRGVGTPHPGSPSARCVQATRSRCAWLESAGAVAHTIRQNHTHERLVTGRRVQHLRERR